MTPGRPAPRLSKPLKHLGACGASGPAPRAGSRQAVVKGWATTHVGTTAGHARDLSQAGQEIEGGRGERCTATEVEVNDYACAPCAQDDPHPWRMMLSPRDGARLELQADTRASMAQMAHHVGGTLEWIAATHQDTVYVQTPVRSRGRDLAARDLFLTPHEWAYEVRHGVQDMAIDLWSPSSRDALCWMHRAHTEPRSPWSVWTERQASMATRRRETPERRQGMASARWPERG
jgi:hypothetical protein